MCQVLSEKHMTPKAIIVFLRDNAQDCSSSSSSSSSLQQTHRVPLTKDTLSAADKRPQRLAQGLNCAPFQFHFWVKRELEMMSESGIMKESILYDISQELAKSSNYPSAERKIYWKSRCSDIKVTGF